MSNKREGEGFIYYVELDSLIDSREYTYEGPSEKVIEQISVDVRDSLEILKQRIPEICAAIENKEPEITTEEVIDLITDVIPHREQNIDNNISKEDFKKYALNVLDLYYKALKDQQERKKEEIINTPYSEIRYYFGPTPEQELNQLNKKISELEKLIQNVKNDSYPIWLDFSTFGSYQSLYDDFTQVYQLSSIVDQEYFIPLPEVPKASADAKKEAKSEQKNSNPSPEVPDVPADSGATGDDLGTAVPGENGKSDGKSGKGWTRVGGGVQLAFGVFEAVVGGIGGILAAETGVGALVGFAILMNGVDNIVAGWKQLWTGESQDTSLHTWVKSKAKDLGASEEIAEKIANGVEISTAFLGGFGGIKVIFKKFKTWIINFSKEIIEKEWKDIGKELWKAGSKVAKERIQELQEIIKNPKEFAGKVWEDIRSIFKRKKKGGVPKNSTEGIPPKMKGQRPPKPEYSVIDEAGNLTEYGKWYYERPSGHRTGIREKVWKDAADTDGIVKDPLTQKNIKPNDPWDMGHKPGFEFRKHQKSAAQRGISREQFLNEYNTPEYYRPELPASNRSHVGEVMEDIYLGD